MTEKWLVDPCVDANGFHTIRVDNGTECGDLARQPIATVYKLEDAESLVEARGVVRGVAALVTAATNLHDACEHWENQDDPVLADVRKALIPFEVTP